MLFKNVIKLTVSILLFSFSISAYSQDQDFQFTHYTTEEGLSQSNVTCILQDSKGFMWFGTFNGLNRFNGYDFETFHYQQDDSNSLSHNYISALMEDRNGYIWVGTSGGLSRYNRKMNNFKSFKYQKENPASISDNPIEAILQDSQGRIWIGTRNGGLDLYEGENGSFIHYKHDANDPTSLSSNAIRELFEDRAGNLWIAHKNGFIDILDLKSVGSDRLEIHKEKISGSEITDIIETEDKHIWISTQGDGLFRLQFKKDQLQRIAHYLTCSRNIPQISSNIILSLMADSQSKVWIGTEDKGINILDLKSNSIHRYTSNPNDPSSLSHYSIWDIFEDQSGNIWVGTYAQGVNLLIDRKKHFQHFKYNPGSDNTLSNNMVKAFAEDENQNLWIATDGGGLNFFDRKKNRFTHYSTENSNLETDVIVSLKEDRKGRLWLGTWTKGLFLFDKTTKKFEQYSKEKYGLGSDQVLHITEDRTGGLWLATYQGGLTYFNVDKSIVQVYNTRNSALYDNYVRTTLQDLDGNLWIGTDRGLEFFNTNTKEFIHYIHHEHDARSISKGFVHSIIQSRDSSIWIGTTGGLNKFNSETKSFIHYNTRDGLTNDEIKCIIEDNDSALWVSTNKGISCFDRESNIFQNYDVIDGLQGNEFNIRSGLLTTNGEIVFGGNNGFNLFKPPIKKVNRIVPPVVITDFKLFNKSVPIKAQESLLKRHISETKKITLQHYQNVFSFDFVALNYISPQKNQYAYMMEGFESDWNYVGSRRTATYTNLDPGEYIFKVKASNNNGLWNEQGTSIIIEIEPPFWKTWWAYLIEVLFIIAIISFIFNYFISRQRLKNALNLEHLELEKMYEMDQMKTQFFTNIAHEFYSPLTLILSPLQKLIASTMGNEKLKNSLVLILNNAQRLQRMTNQLKDFQKMETGDLQLSLSRGNIIRFVEQIVNSFQDYACVRQIDFKFNAVPKKTIEWFDSDKLDKIIYNLLSNAFKFTPNKGQVEVKLSINYPDNKSESKQFKSKAIRYLEIDVQDTGIGIPEDKINHIFERYYHLEEYKGQQYEGSGVGLAFVYELVQVYGGEISVSSDEGKGSCFLVKIPLDEHYLEENLLVGEFNITGFDLDSDTNTAEVEQSSHGQEEKTNLLKAPAMDVPVILVVEDDDEIRKYIKSSLEIKYRIISAKNGRQGIKKAIKTVPDLIISDIKMPEVEGTELCNQLKNDERTSHIPIILLTAFSSSEKKIEGLKTGADVYLTKPFNLDEMEAHITNLLQSRRKLRAKFSYGIIPGKSKNKLKNLDEQFLQRTMKIIEKHLSDSKLNADILGKEVGMSRMQLYRKIRGLTNQTVNELIRTIRLQKAVQLLQENQLTITEVAFEVGFNDLTYFARCFKKQFKKSPSEYIKKRS